MVRHGLVCNPNPVGTSPQHKAGPTAHHSVRRGLDSPGICDQLQFPGAQETQIQRYRDCRGEEGEQELQQGPAGWARCARGWKVMVENKATELLCTAGCRSAPVRSALRTGAVPAPHGSVLSSARPHPAQPAVSHAVTPRLCKLSKRKRTSCWHGCFSPPPTGPSTDPSRAHPSRRSLHAAADSSATAAMPGMRPPPPRCRAAARERHRLGPTAGTADPHPALEQGKLLQEEAVSPESHRCTDAAQPTLCQEPKDSTGLSCALWEGCLLLPCACAAGSPSRSPGSIRHLSGALHRQNRGEHSSLQSLCLSFPLSSPGDALSCTENSWGDAHLRTSEGSEEHPGMDAELPRGRAIPKGNGPTAQSQRGSWI